MQMDPRRQQAGMNQIAGALGQPTTVTQGVVAPGTAMPTPSGMINKPMMAPSMEEIQRSALQRTPQVSEPMPNAPAPMAAPMARPQGRNAGELGQPWGLRFGRPGGR